MLAKVMSCAIVGLEADLVDVEVDIIRGGPAFNLVGLPDAAVRESRDRVHSAIKNSGLTFPSNKRITVNLAPADLRKEGPAYDLPIAVGVLAASSRCGRTDWTALCSSVNCRWMARRATRKGFCR